VDGPSTIAPTDLARRTCDPGWMRTLRLEVKLGRLPRDVGAVLLTVGAVGLVIPGPLPPGLTFLAIGTVILSPKLLRPFGGCLRKRLPLIYRVFEMQVSRFNSDLEHRYPGSTSRGRKVGSARRSGRSSADGPPEFTRS
jgi:hypothetical protein